MSLVQASPQQSFAHMAGSPSSQPPKGQVPPSSYGHSYNMSFGDSHSQPSFPSSGPMPYPIPQSYSRSFGGESYGGRPQQAYEGKPQIYTVRAYIYNSTMRPRLLITNTIIGCLLRR